MRYTIGLPIGTVRIDNSDFINITATSSGYGFSVRCVKDNTTRSGYHTSVPDVISNKVTKAFPNPASDFTNLDYSLKAEHSGFVEIYNSMGELIERYLLANGTHRLKIETNQYAGGTYMYKYIVDDGEVSTGKFIVVK